MYSNYPKNPILYSIEISECISWKIIISFWEIEFFGEERNVILGINN